MNYYLTEITRIYFATPIFGTEEMETKRIKYDSTYRTSSSGSQGKINAVF